MILKLTQIDGLELRINSENIVSYRELGKHRDGLNSEVATTNGNYFGVKEGVADIDAKLAGLED